MKELKEIAKELLPDESNAILLAEKMKRTFEGHGNVYYIDTSGIIRFSKNGKNQWVLVDGHNMPSKIKGKAIAEAWKLFQVGKKWDSDEIDQTQISEELNLGYEYVGVAWKDMSVKVKDRIVEHYRIYE